MRYDTPQNIEAVRDVARAAAREAIATLNALEALKQPSQRWHYSLESQTTAQREREMVPMDVLPVF